MAPSMMAQNTRWGTGDSNLPPDVRWSTTSEPESEEVTKNEITRMMPTSEVNAGQGERFEQVEHERWPRSH